MKVIRMELTPNDIASPSVRYDADCSCVQSLVAGTWVDNPAADPRTSPAFALPAPSGVDQKCNAATGITANFKSGLDASLSALNATGNALAVGSVVLNILDFLDGIGVIAQLFVDFGALILGIGTSAVNGAFTDSVYAELACTLYCDSSADGTFTETQFDKVLSDIASSFGEFSTVNIVLNSWLNNLGFVGLSNVGAQKAITGDCSDCECGWCYEFDFTVSDGGWVAATAGFGAEGIYVPASGWQMSALQDDGCSGHGYLSISYALGLTADNITGLELWWSNPNPDAGTQFFDQVLSGALELRQDLSAEIANANPSFDVTAASCDTVRLVNFQCGQNALFPFLISKVRFSGVGTNPFGSDNC